MWFSNFLENALVNRVKRRICIRCERCQHHAPLARAVAVIRAAKLLRKDEARRIAPNIAKLSRTFAQIG
jgi:hypothetical protein